MMETIQSAFASVRDLLSWAPNNVVGVIILALAAVIALSIHRTRGREVIPVSC